MSRHPSLMLTEDQINISGPSFVGLPNGSPAGAAQEITPTQAIGLLPPATLSNDGKMTAAQVALLLGRYQGAGTTAQRNALSSPQAGWQWYNTDFQRNETYNGTLWLAPGHRMMTNRTGSSDIYGYSVIMDIDNDNSVIFPDVEKDIRVVGVVAFAAANLSQIAVAVSGVAEVLFWNDERNYPGEWAECRNDGTNQVGSYAGLGRFGICMTNDTSSSPFLAKCELKQFDQY